jgi:hypothetical protein
MGRFPARLRATLLLAFSLGLGLTLAADDHFRTGGVFQDPFPLAGDPSIVKVDQRFHVGDPATLGSTHMYIGCHAGDTINPGTLVVVIPGGAGG